MQRWLLLLLLCCCCRCLEAAAVKDTDEAAGKTESGDTPPPATLIEGSKGWREGADTPEDEEPPTISEIEAATAAAPAATLFDTVDGEALFDVSDTHAPDAEHHPGAAAEAATALEEAEKKQQRKHEKEMLVAEETLKAQLGREEEQLHGLTLDIHWLKTAIKDLDFASESLGQTHPSQHVLDRLTERTSSLEERLQTYMEGNFTEFRNHISDHVALRLLPLQQEYVDATYRAASLATEFRTVTEDMRKVDIDVNLTAGEHLKRLRLWSADEGAKFQEALREAQPKLVEQFEQQKREEQTRVNFAVLEEIRVKAAAEDALAEIETRGSAFSDLSGCCEGYVATEVAELLLSEFGKINKRKRRIAPIFIVTEAKPPEPQAPPRVLRLPRVDLRAEKERAAKRHHNDDVKQEFIAKLAEFKRVARQITNELVTSKVPTLARLLPQSAGESVKARAATLQAERALQDARDRFSQLPTQLGGAPKRSIVPPLYSLQRLVASTRNLGNDAAIPVGARTPYFLLSVDGLLIDAVKIDASGVTPLAIRYPPPAIPLGPPVLHASYGLAMSKAFSFIKRSSAGPSDVPVAYMFPPPVPTPCGTLQKKKTYKSRLLLMQQNAQGQQQEKSCSDSHLCSVQDLPVLPKYHNPFKGCTGFHLGGSELRNDTGPATDAATEGAAQRTGAEATEERGSMTSTEYLPAASTGDAEEHNAHESSLYTDGHVSSDVAMLQALADQEFPAEAAAAAAARDAATAAMTATKPPGGSKTRKLQSVDEAGTSRAGDLMHTDVLQHKEEFRKTFDSQKQTEVSEALLYSEEDDGEPEAAPAPAAAAATRHQPGAAEGGGEGNAGQEEEEAVLVVYLGSRQSGSPLIDGDGNLEAVMRRHKLLYQSAKYLLTRLAQRSVALDSKQGEVGIRTSLLSLRREHHLQQPSSWAQHFTERSLPAMGVNLQVGFGPAPLLLLPLSPFFTRSVLIIRVHATRCKRGRLAVPSTEALQLALLLAGYPGGAHAATANCRKQLDQMIAARAPTPPPRLASSNVQQEKSHVLQEVADGAPGEDQQKKQKTGTCGSHQGKQQQQQLHQQPIISMIKAWAYHGGMAGESSTVVHLSVSSTVSSLYVQPGGAETPYAQALYQESATAVNEGLSEGPPSCMSPPGIFAGAMKQKESCVTPIELVESIATRMQAEVVPALYQRPMRGRTVLITIAESESAAIKPESFLAVELIAAAVARRQQDSMKA